MPCRSSLPQVEIMNVHIGPLELISFIVSIRRTTMRLNRKSKFKYVFVSLTKKKKRKKVIKICDISVHFFDKCMSPRLIPGDDDY